MSRELRITVIIMAVALIVSTPLIFAAPGPANTNYLAMVFHVVAPTPVPTATNTPLPSVTPLPSATVTRTPTNTPVIGVTITPTPGPPPTRTPTSHCAAEYPYDCFPPPPPDLDCSDIPQRNFTVLPPDRHGFDGDNDGIGCEA
jgi:hypothetical protein